MEEKTYTVFEKDNSIYTLTDCTLQDYNLRCDEIILARAADFSIIIGICIAAIITAIFYLIFSKE